MTAQAAAIMDKFDRMVETIRTECKPTPPVRKKAIDLKPGDVIRPHFTECTVLSVWHRFAEMVCVELRSSRGVGITHYYLTDEWELFDLERDPRELRSAYADPAYAGVVRELQAGTEMAAGKERRSEAGAESQHQLHIFSLHCSIALNGSVIANAHRLLPEILEGFLKGKTDPAGIEVRSSECLAVFDHTRKSY